MLPVMSNRASDELKTVEAKSLGRKSLYLSITGIVITVCILILFIPAMLIMRRDY